MSLPSSQARSVRGDGEKIVDSELGEGIKERKGLCVFGGRECPSVQEFP